jgi:hypothetical protein
MCSMAQVPLLRFSHVRALSAFWSAIKLRGVQHGCNAAQVDAMAQLPRCVLDRQRDRPLDVEVTGDLSHIILIAGKPCDSIATLIPCTIYPPPRAGCLS